jgi:hypothetical protein
MLKDITRQEPTQWPAVNVVKQAASGIDARKGPEIYLMRRHKTIWPRVVTALKWSPAQDKKAAGTPIFEFIFIYIYMSLYHRDYTMDHLPSSYKRHRLNPLVHAAQINVAPKKYQYFTRGRKKDYGSNKEQPLQPLQKNDAHIIQSSNEYTELDDKYCNFYKIRHDKHARETIIYDKDACMEFNDREWMWKEPKRNEDGSFPDKWETGWVLRKPLGFGGLKLQNLDSWKDGLIQFVAVEAKDHETFKAERWPAIVSKLDREARSKNESQKWSKKKTEMEEKKEGIEREKRDMMNQEGRARSRKRKPKLVDEKEQIERENRDKRDREKRERNRGKRAREREREEREEMEGEKGKGGRDKKKRGFKGIITKVVGRGRRSDRYRELSGGNDMRYV